MRFVKSRGKYLNALRELFDNLVYSSCRTGHRSGLKKQECENSVNLVKLVNGSKVCAPIVRFILRARIEEHIGIVHIHRVEPLIALLGKMPEAYLYELALGDVVQIDIKTLEVLIALDTRFANRFLFVE